MDLFIVKIVSNGSFFFIVKIVSNGSFFIVKIVSNGFSLNKI